jgi:hypothetical protein
LAGGLLIDRPLFEPILQWLLVTGHYSLRLPLYDPKKLGFFIVLIAAVSILWVGLSIYAFIRQPAKDRAIDQYLYAREQVDHARRATMVSEQDPES